MISAVLERAARLMDWTMVSIVGFYARIFPPAEIDKGDSERAGGRTGADGMAGSARAADCSTELRPQAATDFLNQTRVSPSPPLIVEGRGGKKMDRVRDCVNGWRGAVRLRQKCEIEERGRNVSC